MSSHYSSHTPCVILSIGDPARAPPARDLPAFAPSATGSVPAHDAVDGVEGIANAADYDGGYGEGSIGEGYGG